MTMLNYNAHRLIALHDQRWAALGDWRNRWEEIAFYVMPQQRSFTSHHNPGNRRQENLVFDSTALEANERLATRMQEALTNPSSNWFVPEFEDDKANNEDAAREWTEDCAVRMRNAIRKSNFDMTMGQYYLDIPAFGTSFVACDEKKAEYPDEDGAVFHGLNFKCMHMEGITVAEDPSGTVDTIFHRFDMTSEQLVQKFDKKAPKRARDYVEAGKPDTMVKVLLCRFKRTLNTRPTGLLLPKERPWAEVWINYSDKEIIEDGGSYEQSAFCGRWRKKSEDIMGYGPGERALPTIRTVNEAERLELAAWAKVIDPPIKTTQNNVVGDVDIKSKGITVVRDMANTDQWDLRPDLNHHMIQLEDKRYQIREIFKYHALELPAREQVGEMTAYEISKRVEQIYRALGATVVQQEADVLNGMMARVFGIMYRKGALLPVPEPYADLELRMNYVGPMALAARGVEIDAMDKWIADSMAMAQNGAEGAMDYVDIDMSQKYKARITGVPAIVVRDDDEVADIREARAKLAQAEADAAQYQQKMAGMKDGAAALESGALQQGMTDGG